MDTAGEGVAFVWLVVMLFERIAQVMNEVSQTQEAVERYQSAESSEVPFWVVWTPIWDAIPAMLDLEGLSSFETT